MRIHFNLEYRTTFGEALAVNVEETEGTISTHMMETDDGAHWHLSTELDVNEKNFINYFYSVEKDRKRTRTEWLTEAHRLELSAHQASHYILHDHWIDRPEDAFLYSSAITDCTNRHSARCLVQHHFRSTLRLKVRAPQLRKGERLALAGNMKCMGCWKPELAVEMHEHNYNEWIADIDATQLEGSQMAFKFIIINQREDVSPLWERGFNRTLELPQIGEGEVLVKELPDVQFDIYPIRIAGTLVPVFSLRSSQSYGVGDFGDLKKIIAWAAQTQQRILQLLPINDTTLTHEWTDSYPYSCISVFALHPQYADLTALPPIKDPTLRQKYEDRRLELNALRQIDYERVNKAKTEYLHIIFEQEGKAMMASGEFKRFFADTETWLTPYAYYCYLRDTFHTPDFSQWDGHQTWNERDRKALCNPRTKLYKEVAFYYFVQFVLYTQMSEAHAYARQQEVILKGDIPIGVHRQGCDVWMEPKYFNLNGQAGAPPDDFSTNGQNWGFPTYNWDEMMKDGCSWWTRRFRNMALFFDAYRIDHVLGFFRIWEIPTHAVHGLLGQFAPALGMTAEEINMHGLPFKPELYLTPYIRDWVIERTFGQHADAAKHDYLIRLHDDVWALKPEYDTERKIEVAFKGKNGTDDIFLRDGLYALVSNVLFLRDHRTPDLYHPRISAYQSLIYESLSGSDKQAFDWIYNDYFYQRNNHFWYTEAMKKLPRLIDATRMLVCAEDLGMVPECVPWVMDQLRVLTLEMQWMPKECGTRFGHLSHNPYRSVCTISSHDTPTLRQWWDEDWQRTQEYYNTMLHRSGDAPHPLPGWLAKDIVSRHLTSPSMLCIISLQDWLAIDERLRLPDANAERINVPANPHHYWRYRMHLNIEDMMNDEQFTAEIRSLITDTGRKL